MTRTIWKYRITSQDMVLALPGPGAWPLHVGLQPGHTGEPELMLWSQVNPGGPKIVWQIRVVMTGEEMPDGDLRHLGTVQRPDGIVCHVFCVYLGWAA
jgi:hypothetical protein